MDNINKQTTRGRLEISIQFISDNYLMKGQTAGYQRSFFLLHNISIYLSSPPSVHSAAIVVASWVE